MMWDGKRVTCTNEHVRDQRRILNRMLEKKQFQSLDSLEQQRILDERKAKSKEYRAKAAKRKEFLPPSVTNESKDKKNGRIKKRK